MSFKTAKILESIFESEWKNPKYNKLMFYYQLILDNGDIGFVGVIEKGSRRIKKGAMIEYSIDDKNKIRLNSSSNDPKVIAENALAKRSEKVLPKTPAYRGRKQDEFLGFAWGYAKDLMIAGKSLEDIKKLPEMAQYIYDEIGKMLQPIESEQPEEKESKETHTENPSLGQKDEFVNELKKVKSKTSKSKGSDQLSAWDKLNEDF